MGCLVVLMSYDSYHYLLLVAGLNRSSEGIGYVRSVPKMCKCVLLLLPLVYKKVDLSSGLLNLDTLGFA